MPLMEIATGGDCHGGRLSWGERLSGGEMTRRDCPRAAYNIWVSVSGTLFNKSPSQMLIKNSFVGIFVTLSMNFRHLYCVNSVFNKTAVSNANQEQL